MGEVAVSVLLSETVGINLFGVELAPLTEDTDEGSLLWRHAWNGRGTEW